MCAEKSKWLMCINFFSFTYRQVIVGQFIHYKKPSCLIIMWILNINADKNFRWNIHERIFCERNNLRDVFGDGPKSPREM